MKQIEITCPENLKAAIKYVKRTNGASSYIPTSIYKDGVEVSDEELDQYYYTGTIS